VYRRTGAETTPQDAALAATSGRTPASASCQTPTTRVWPAKPTITHQACLRRNLPHGRSDRREMRSRQSQPLFSPRRQPQAIPSTSEDWRASPSSRAATVQGQHHAGASSRRSPTCTPQRQLAHKSQCHRGDARGQPSSYHPPAHVPTRSGRTSAGGTRPRLKTGGRGRRGLGRRRRQLDTLPDPGSRAPDRRPPRRGAAAAMAIRTTPTSQGTRTPRRHHPTVARMGSPPPSSHGLCPAPRPWRRRGRGLEGGGGGGI
jgi:hypothetical protein